MNLCVFSVYVCVGMCVWVCMCMLVCMNVYVSFSLYGNIHIITNTYTFLPSQPPPPPFRPPTQLGGFKGAGWGLMVIPSSLYIQDTTSIAPSHFKK